MVRPPKAKQYKYDDTPYAMDAVLIERVKQYLNGAGGGSRYVQLDQMATHLQLKYADYRRRKRLPFRVLVQRTYEHVATELRHEFASSSNDSPCDSSDEGDREERAFDNSINESLTQLYSQIPVTGCQLPKPQTTGTPLDQSKCDKQREIMGSPIDTTTTQHSITLDRVGSANSSRRQREEQLASASATNTPPVRRKSQVKCKREIETEAVKMTAGAFKKKRVRGSEFKCEIPSRTLDEVGGHDQALLALHDVLEDFVEAQAIPDSASDVDSAVRLTGDDSTGDTAERVTAVSVVRSRGVLLHGPPGCGKTLLAEAVAGELKLPFISCASTELVSGVSGDSELRIRQLFDDAQNCAPCVLFIDEIDALTSKRELAQRDMERRIVSQLIKCFDLLASSGRAVLVLGATNFPDQLDSALRRAKRFDQEVELPVPDAAGRRQIVSVLCSGKPLAEDVDLVKLARLTPGYVGADLFALVAEAGRAARRRRCSAIAAGQAVSTGDSTGAATDNRMAELGVRRAMLQRRLKAIREGDFTSQHTSIDNALTWSDFEAALSKVQPSALREGFITVPDVTWQDVGALSDVRDELQYKILDRVRDPGYYTRLGLLVPSGVLICGPPGCGKTLLAKAVANEAAINFLAVKGPELFNMYVGESERAIRQVFQRARNSAPCVVFFDEIDSVCGRRDAVDSGSSSRVVNQLLTELDGLGGRAGVYLLAATNRPDTIDPAVLRPGRVDKLLYIGLPSAEERADILRAVTRSGQRPRLAADVDLAVLARDDRCEGMTGADLASVVREAAELTARERLEAVECRHLQMALDRIVPSVRGDQRDYYERVRLMCTNGRCH